MVSVVLAVHNGEPHLKNAVDSVLSQSFDSLELIVVDDGSTDGSVDVIEGIGDTRVRILSQPRTGLTRALNAGARVARGDFIARMDADDVSLPDRLATQVAFMEQNAHVVAVGTDYEVIDDGGRKLGESSVPHEFGDVRHRLMTIGNCLAHGSSMIRRSAFREVGGYREAFVAAQDYDLWLRLSEIGEVRNIGPILYQWRLATGSITLERYAVQSACAAVAREAAERRSQGASEDLEGLFAKHRSPQLATHRRVVRRRANSSIRCSLGVRMLDAGDARLASRRFLEAIGACPANPRAWFMLLMCASPRPLRARLRKLARSVVEVRESVRRRHNPERT